MHPERWQQIAVLFEEVLALAEKDREAFLDEKCGGDATLREQVVKLLEADGEAGGLLDLDEPMASEWPAPASGMPDAGDRLGPYRLLRQIGAGGMGVVFLASRDDESFRRKVAVKLLSQGRAGEDAHRRLRIERQVLASLDHPNIAILHDAGATPEGLPYFVMEHVEGVPIDAYCEQNELTLEERIELFLVVCEAVEVAHRSLVVHRDIKPSNILVTADGVPKLLDFGIAKLLRPELLGVDEEATEERMRVLTPGYASPEQARGLPVTTASDVYSLGALLFKLLTGQLPRAAEVDDRTELEREPPNASETLAGDPLARKLRGDLDSILTKALRASPRHRYATVSQLTDDLRRYASHRPVLARKGNLRYQAGKLLRRHRLGAVVAALLAAFTLVTVAQVIQVRGERSRARHASQAKDAVIALVVGLFETANVNLNQGRQLTVLEALEYGEEWFLDDDLVYDVQVTLREVIGRVYLSLGEDSPAAAQLRRVFELETVLRGEESLESAKARGLYAQALRLGDPGAAVREGRRSVETIRNLLGDDSRELVRPLNDLVTSYCYLSDFESAAGLSRTALELSRRWFGSDSLETSHALSNRAAVSRHQGDLEAAAEAYRQALAIHRRHLPESHPEIVDLLSNVASVARAAGDLGGSESLYDEVLRLQRRIYLRGHPYIGRTLNNLSNVYFDQGRSEESVETLREAIGVLHRTLGSDHPMVGQIEIKLAGRLVETGRPEEAMSLLEERRETWGSLGLESRIGELEAALAGASGTERR